MATLGVYRMSEVGGCARSLSARRLGYTPYPAPSWLELAAKEGKRHELWIKEEMAGEGYDIEVCDLCEQCCEEFGDEREGLHVEINHALFRVIGHMDGRILREGNEPKRPLEIKAPGRFNFDKFIAGGFSAFPKYAAQEACYLTAEGESTWPGFYIVKNRDTGKKVMFDVDKPPMPMGDIIDKLEWVEANARQGKLVDVNGGCTDPNYCGFRFLCEKAPAKVEAVGASGIPDDIIQAIEYYKNNYAMTKEVDRAHDAIKAWMIDTTQQSVLVNGIVAKITQASRTSYNGDELKKYLDPDILALCAKVSKYPELRIKIIKEEGEL